MAQQLVGRDYNGLASASEIDGAWGNRVEFSWKCLQKGESYVM